MDIDKHPAVTCEQLLQRGWNQRELPGFIGTAGPLWTRREEDGWHYGIHCRAGHLNPAGVAHGGVVATLLDHAMSTVAWEASGRAPCVTLQLDTHYLAAVGEGQFIEVTAHCVHRTRGLVFTRGVASVDGREVASAQAVLKVLREGVS